MGGTGNGSDCVFPFIYQGASFSTCIYRTVTIGTQISFALFCSTTSNLDQHGLWGYCLGKNNFISYQSIKQKKKTQNFRL